MQAPRAEQALVLAVPLAINLLHALGEADGDTWCEQARAALDRIPHGHVLSAAALAAFWVHLTKPRRFVGH